MKKEKEIFSDICLILKESFDKNNISLESTLSKGENSLDLNSLEIVSFIVKVEENFNIIIDFDVLFVTVQDVVNEVQRLLNQ